jgi:hypothetical protein
VELNTKTILLAIDVPSDFRVWTPASFQRVEPHLFADESQSIANVEGQTKGDEASGPPPIESRAGECVLGRLTITHGSNAIPLWTFRQSLVEIPLALGTFALAFAALLGLTTFKAAGWLAARQPLVLAIVGTAWWLCLSPRAVGIGLVVASLVWFASRQKARRSRRRNNLPSTVHLPA